MSYAVIVLTLTFKGRWPDSQEYDECTVSDRQFLSGSLSFNSLWLIFFAERLRLLRLHPVVIDFTCDLFFVFLARKISSKSYLPWHGKRRTCDAVASHSVGEKVKKEKQTIRFFQLNPSQGTLWKGSSSSSGWLVVWLIRNERATNGNV